MKFPKLYCYEVIGQDSYYEEIMPELEEILKRELGDEEEHYLVAINEAICNAARYAVDGCDKVDIKIQVLVNDGDIKTTVTADTEPFDVVAFRKKMKEMMNDKNLSKMEWGDYTGNSDKSRGFWLILMACEYLFLDTSGKTVTLCARKPYDPKSIRKKIGELVPRLYIEKDGSVL